MKQLLFLFPLVICVLSVAQVPQGINYQAVAHNSAGAPIMNTSIQVKIGILSDTLTPVVVWEELHSTVKTNTIGVFALVIGTGTKQSGTALTFSEVDWTKPPLFLKVQINFQGSWKNLGSTKLWTVPYAMVADELSGSVKKLSVSGETTDMEEALFEVKNKNGQTVFAVYNEGVRIYVDDGSKSSKGGFSIGGFGSTKAPSQNLFVVNPDSIRAYIDTNNGRGAKGGFSIGGFGSVKASGEEYFRVTRDSTKIYLNDEETRASKGGFSVGGFASAKGLANDYMLIHPDNTKFYVRTESSGTSSTFNIISVDQNDVQKSLLTANPDTIVVSGVLNLQNNLIVDGNLDVSGIVSQDSSKISDVDGNSYNTIIIGTQVWMKENLKTTKFNDGSLIPHITDSIAWINLTTPAFCWYKNNESSYKAIYGGLYNWPTVNTGKLCPSGWHVPSDEEWTILTTYLGGESGAGGKLKETGTTHWQSPNVGATNETGFTAIPQGIRNYLGNFYNLGKTGYWWSSTDFPTTPTAAWARTMDYNNSIVLRGGSTKPDGLSIRCLKN